METEIIKSFISQGAFTLLFVWLFFDTRKDSKNREEKYQETINKLADNLGEVKSIKEDVEEIKEYIFK